jgi:2-amino-4-hydroxy-6-hydroxymethyldihydropteridine diphosphokinase
VDRVAVAIAIGSNLGDREAHLAVAFERLATLLDGCRRSRVLETLPVGGADIDPLFLNAAVVGHTTLSARTLLDRLAAIESERGRARPYRQAPRTLDLDLILYGDRLLDEPGLIVPHPRFRERAFVLEPLVEIAPDFVDPVTGKTVAELLEAHHRRS